MNLAKLTPIALAAVLSVALMGAQCTPQEISRYEALITGKAVPTDDELRLASSFLAEHQVSQQNVVAVVSSVSSSSVSSEVSVAIVEPEVIVPEVVVPPPCENWTWRGRVYSCTGEWLYDL